MRRMRSSLLSSSALSMAVVLTSLFLLIGPMAQAQTGRAVLITQSVDESKLITLAGNTRPEANKQNDRGLVADDQAMDHMMLQLKRSPQQERQLQQFIQQQEDKSSPNFHHWLTAKEYGERFGLAQQDLGVITGWLQSHGLRVNVVYENGTLIDFSGTSGQVRAAFHTEIHQLSVKGVKHFANMSDPQIPVALAPAVVGVVSLHDFKPHTNYKPRASYTTNDSCDFGNCYPVVPGDLATIYNINPLFTAGISGQGQTIVVVEDTDVYSTADWTTFRSTFGLSTYTGGSFTQVHPAPPSGTTNCTDPGVNGDDVEAILDAEYASAAAPSATIELASCNGGETGATFGGLIALQNLLNESSTPPAVMSISYGECEAYNGASANAAYSAAYQQAVTEGVSVFVSTGDEGAASCNAGENNATLGIGVSGFASTPYNVAVGGTDFGDTYAGSNTTYWSTTNSATYESALSYIPEIPWNDSCASELIATFLGYSQTFGTNGLCNSGPGITTASGSGGPSGCATGSPSVGGVVGGTCAGWPKPSWQSLVGNPTDTVRDIPDVSLFAANGVWDHFYPFCYSDPNFQGSAPCTGTPDTWAGGGGTSFATPIMAGIQALINQKVGARQGNPNPGYYTLAATQYGLSGDATCSSTLGSTTASTCVFYDVTQGDMDVNCTGTNNCYLPSGTYGVLSTSNASYLPAFGTTTGWDFATGIGTINAYNLATAWTNLGKTATTTTIVAAPTTAVFGQTVTLTATVTPSAATGQVNFFNNNSTTALGTATLVSGVATFTTTTLPAGSDVISATYVGDSNYASSSTTISATVTVTNPAFTVTTPTAPAPAAAGQSTITTFTVTPTGTTTFPITFACNGLPDATVSCAFSPTQIATGTTGVQTVTLTISTTGPNTGQAGGVRRSQRRADNHSPWLPLALPLAGVVVVGLTGRKWSKHSAVAGLCVSLMLLGLMLACGGSSSQPIAVTISGPSSSLYPNDQADNWPLQQVQFAAAVSNTTNTAVTWAVTTPNGGTIDATGLYTAPTIAAGLPTSVTITATSQADTSKVGTTTLTLKPATVPGTYPITVTATEGPTSNTTASFDLVVN